MMIDLRNIEKTYITDDIGNWMAYVMIDLLCHPKTCEYTGLIKKIPIAFLPFNEYTGLIRKMPITYFPLNQYKGLMRKMLTT